MSPRTRAFRAHLVPLTLALFLASAGAVAGPAQRSTWRSDDIVGLWSLEAESGEVHVRIATTGEGGYSGTIVWLEQPQVPDGDPSGLAGQPKTDLNNPDERLRDRPIVGLQILRGFRYDEESDEWRDGRIYDPEKGKEYRCTLRLGADGTLHVRGYIKVGFLKLGRTMDWEPVSDR